VTSRFPSRAPLSLVPVACTEPPPAPAVRGSRALRLGIAVAVVLLTASVLGKAHPPRKVASEVVSGAPEVSRSEDGSSKRWHQPELVVYVDESVRALGDGAEDAVASAFQAWSAAGTDLPRVRLVPTQGATAGLEADGRNTVTVGRIDMAGREDAVAVTVIHSDTQTGEILEADVIINARKAMALLGADAEAVEASPDSEGRPEHEGHAPEPAREIPSCNGLGRQGGTCDYHYDLQNIVTHEVGHFMGLGEDHEDPLATTYYCTSKCETHKRTLTDADAAAAQALYASRASTGPEVQCSAARIGSRPARPAQALAGLGLLLLVLAARRR
jgi:hypothetical protein